MSINRSRGVALMMFMACARASMLTLARRLVTTSWLTSAVSSYNDSVATQVSSVRINKLWLHAVAMVTGVDVLCR